jgi:hypothetical protein
MEKNIGIVLKNYQPQKCKLAILDRDHGKIMAVPNRTDISHGALITYFTREQEHISFIHSIDILDLPLALAQEDITFVHHVLELCYYFIPMGSHASQVFIALLRFYEYPIVLNNQAMKKIFLVQLFFLLGVYPEALRSKSASIHHVISTSIDTWAASPIDLRIEQELDEWLMQCIKTHPRAEYFKTVHFLLMNKAL